MIDVDAPFANRCELGEGPHWNERTRRLTYVDIDAGTIHELDPTTATETSVTIQPPLSFAVPVVGTSDVVCGTGAQLTLLDPNGGQLGQLMVERGKPGNRFNDGKADPAGRLWFGSMSLDHTPRDAALYRLDDRGLRTVDDAVTLSNGLDWDLDRQRMYYVDSTEHRIDVFDYDVATGAVDERRAFATIDVGDGLPDGLTVDADGGVWVALFRGGAIRRYDPDGGIVDTVHLPVTCPTCPVFGGDDLTTLFVTTSRHRLSESERRAQPLAGAILTVDPGARGRPGSAVAGEVAAVLRSGRGKEPR